jgi:iron-sulfur cluster repair protein YtfE (RIC family)
MITVKLTEAERELIRNLLRFEYCCTGEVQITKKVTSKQYDLAASIVEKLETIKDLDL